VIPTEEQVQAVLTAIESHEDNPQSGASNADLDAATGLDPQTVDDALDYLWSSARIEGVLAVCGRRPCLHGIRRVVPGRRRIWGSSGYYRKLPR
jgi:hypothetical protein